MPQWARMALAARSAVTARRDRQRGFRRCLAWARGWLEGLDQALDPNECRDQRLPFGFCDDGRGIEHGNFPGLVAIALFGVNGLGIGERFAGVAGDFGLLVQGRLVVLDLDDQMEIGGARGPEGFFGGAWRRR